MNLSAGRKRFYLPTEQKFFDLGGIGTRNPRILITDALVTDRGGQTRAGRG